MYSTLYFTSDNEGINKSLGIQGLLLVLHFNYGVDIFKFLIALYEMITSKFTQSRENHKKFFCSFFLYTHDFINPMCIYSG
jgi:hypothetical protein